MALIAYNLTAAPLVLAAGNPVPTIKASPTAGVRSQGFDVTTELLGLTAANYAAIQAQVAAGLVSFIWTNYQEYPTPGLSVLASDSFIAVDDFLIWASPTGVVGAAGTAANPTTLDDALARLPPTWAKKCELNMLPGTYSPLLVGGFGSSGTQLPGAASRVIIGDFTNELGGQTSTLTTDPGAGGGVLDLASVIGFPTSGLVLIGAELITYTGIAVNTLTGCVRGALGTIAVAHAIGSAVTISQACTAADVNGRSITFPLVNDTTTLTDNPLPVWAAAGTITAIVPGGLADNQVLVLNDGLNPAVNFEFKVTGAFQSKAALPRAVVDVTAAVTAADVATAIFNAVNSTASAVQPNPLAITAQTPVGAVVTFVNDRSDIAGNVVITTTSPMVVTGMAGGVATTVVNVPVAGTALFDNEGFFQIDAEIFMYTGKTASSFTGVTRAVRNTVQASHLVGATVTRLDKYRGYSVSITIAGVIQQSREITAVSATGQIDVRSKFSPAPAAGAIFRIEKPAVKININATTPLFPDGITLWGQKGIEWHFTAGNLTLGFADGSFNVSSDGVWITGLSNAVTRSVVNVVRQGKIAGGANTAQWASQYSAATNPFSATRQRGTYMRYVKLSMSEYGEVLNGQFVFDDVLTDFIDGSFDFTAPSFNRVGLQFTRGTTGNVRWDGTPNPIPAIWTGSDLSDATAPDQVFMGEGCIMRRFDGNIQMDNSLGNAISMRAAVVRDLGTSGATINLTGKNAAARGLVLQLGALVQRWNNQGTTLTGFNGEVRNGSSGAAPTRTWADIRTSFPTASASSGGNLFPASRPAFLAPVKQTFTGLTAANTFDITLLGTGLGGIAGNNPALAIAALRVTAATNPLALGSYAVADVAATPLSPAASTIVGLATLSDNGKTLTFPAASLVTAFVLEYVPADLSRYDASIFVNNS